MSVGFIQAQEIYTQNVYAIYETEHKPLLRSSLIPRGDSQRRAQAKQHSASETH